MTYSYAFGGKWKPQRADALMTQPRREEGSWRLVQQVGSLLRRHLSTVLGPSGFQRMSPASPDAGEASVLCTERSASASGHRVTKERCPLNERAPRDAGPCCAQLLQGTRLGSHGGATRDPLSLDSYSQLLAGTSCAPGLQPFYVTGAGGIPCPPEPSQSVSIRTTPPGAPGGPACGPAGALGKQLPPLSGRSGIGQARS